MIDFVMEHGAAVVGGLAGGLAGVLMVIVYWQRKAVDRLVDRIENCPYSSRVEDWRQQLKHQVEWQGHYGHAFSQGYKDKQDGPGIVIARSVRRVTKENP